MKNKEKEELIWTIRDMAKVIKGYAGEVRNLKHWNFSLCTRGEKDRIEIERLKNNLRKTVKMLQIEKDKNNKCEKALKLACRDLAVNTDEWCDDHCRYERNKEHNCVECGMEYYKRKAGIEAE